MRYSTVRQQQQLLLLASCYFNEIQLFAVSSLILAGLGNVHGSSHGLWNHQSCRYTDRHGNTADLLNPPHTIPLKHLQFTEHTFTDTVNITKLCRHMAGITDPYTECFGFRFRPHTDRLLSWFSPVTADTLRYSALKQMTATSFLDSSNSSFSDEKLRL